MQPSDLSVATHNSKRVVEFVDAYVAASNAGPTWISEFTAFLHSLTTRRRVPTLIIPNCDKTGTDAPDESGFMLVRVLFEKIRWLLDDEENNSEIVPENHYLVAALMLKVEGVGLFSVWIASNAGSWVIDIFLELWSRRFDKIVMCRLKQYKSKIIGKREIHEFFLKNQGLTFNPHLFKTSWEPAIEPFNRKLTWLIVFFLSNDSCKLQQV